jgi:5-formyltetrahydrofolate cyclo-ligase
MAVPSIEDAARMTKQALRAEAKARRQAHVASLSAAERCAGAFLMAEAIEASLGDAHKVAAYLPIGSEMDTLPVIERLERRGVAIALPHVTGRRGLMRFLAWTPGDPLPLGPMGLRQPAANAPEMRPDLILTPLLAFDSRLHRLGYGAGHYDRAFASFPDARRIGLAWAIQRIEDLPDDAWDVPLHGVVTERGFVSR